MSKRSCKSIKGLNRSDRLNSQSVWAGPNRDRGMQTLRIVRLSDDENFAVISRGHNTMRTRK